MEDFARMVVTLSKEEFYALKKSAKKEYRNPRDQARYLLRSALLNSLENENSQSATNSQAQSAVAVGV